MISIALDTNILFSSGQDFTKAQFTDKIDEIIGEFESNDLCDYVQIIIPRIVIDELRVKQAEKHKEVTDKIRNIKLPNTTIELIDDYSKHLESLFEKSIESLSQRQLKVKIIDYPHDSCLQNIIQRALCKTAPFEGKEKESDKGFKDVILWESLLCYKRQNPIEPLVLFSKDDRICHQSLVHEFKTCFKDDIHLVRRITENDNSLLYDKISELTQTRRKQTFDEMLKKRLLDKFTSSDLRHLYEGEAYEDGEGSHTCTNIKIWNKEILSIEDCTEDKTIKFVVQIALGAYNEYRTLSEADAACDFHITYNIETDKFHIESYDGLMGDTITLSKDDDNEI